MQKDTKPQNPQRRQALLKIGQNAGFALFGAFVWGAYVNVAKAGNANILRPPGASKMTLNLYQAALNVVCV